MTLNLLGPFFFFGYDARFALASSRGLQSICHSPAK
jgi:hypothetical protein